MVSCGSRCKARSGSGQEGQRAHAHLLTKLGIATLPQQSGLQGDIEHEIWTAEGLLLQSCQVFLMS